MLESLHKAHPLQTMALDSFELREHALSSHMKGLIAERMFGTDHFHDLRPLFPIL
jgi:hypothetical protein